MSDRMTTLRSWFEREGEAFAATLEELAALETPSHDAERIGIFADDLARRLRPHVDDLAIETTPKGPILSARKGAGERQVLILTHMDTVWPVAAPNKPVLRRSGDILHGPGVYDMKAGIALTLTVLRALDELSLHPGCRICFMATPDEEIGSEASRSAIEAAARESAAVLVLEPPLATGEIKTRRKGVGDMRIEITGREAHAGVNPADGINAVHELAHQITRIAALNDPARGITVTCNVIGGGTVENVIAAHAWSTIDFRAETVRDAEMLVETIRALKPILPGAVVSISGGLNRPPMEDSPESRRIARMAQDCGAALGFSFGTAKTGGGSDGNFTAALGIATVDGLGLDGLGAHQPDEQVKLAMMPIRATILAELLMNL
jgi:glutamate carboxypeptidase